MDNLPSFLINRRRSELDLPWVADHFPGEGEGDAGQTVVADWCLYRYLSEGGIRAFPNSTVRAKVIHRQNRFLWICGFLGVLWVVFLLV